MAISVSVEIADGLPPKHMRDLAISACEWYAEYVRDEDLLQVVLVNAPQIIIEGDPCHGSIWYDEDTPNPEISVIHISSNYRKSGISAKDGEQLFLATLFHEFVHYEQLRDCRKVSEKGVDRRAKALLDRYEDETE